MYNGVIKKKNERHDNHNIMYFVSVGEGYNLMIIWITKDIYLFFETFLNR